MIPVEAINKYTLRTMQYDDLCDIETKLWQLLAAETDNDLETALSDIVQKMAQAKAKMAVRRFVLLNKYPGIDHDSGISKDDPHRWAVDVKINFDQHSSPFNRVADNLAKNQATVVASAVATALFGKNWVWQGEESIFGGLPLLPGSPMCDVAIVDKTKGRN